MNLDDAIVSHLKSLKVSQLKNIARYYNLHRDRISFSKLKKRELIDALLKHIDYTPALTTDYTRKRKPRGIKRGISEETQRNLQALEDSVRILKQGAVPKAVAVPVPQSKFNPEDIFRRIAELEALITED